MKSSLLLFLLATAVVEAAEMRVAVILRHGPKWVAGRSVGEQPLLEHGRYLQQLMEAGKLVLAGPFLDNQGGLILLKADSEAEAKAIVERDPAVRDGLMTPEFHPIRIAFGGITGASPFRKSEPAHTSSTNP